jgi:hypothetical protein
MVLGSLSCAFLLNRESTDPEEIVADLRITLQDTELLSHRATVKFQATLQTRLITNFFGFPITSTGPFRVALRYNDQVLASYECIVELPTTPAQMTLIPSG